MGVQTPEEVAAAVRYESLPERERDYSHIFAAEPRFNPKGHCMYCNHCLPCVAHIDIAQVNRYLDLAEAEGTVPPTVPGALRQPRAQGGGVCVVRGM